MTRAERLLSMALGISVGCGGSPPEAKQDAPTAKQESKAEPSDEPADPSLDPDTLPGAIYFVSERDGNLEAYRWRAGAEPERLSDDPRADFVAEVAPDGSGWTRVVAEEGHTPELNREQLSWVPREGAEVPLGPAGRRARAASWAPDRSFVVFESSAEEAFSDIWRRDADGTMTRLTRTEHGAFEPAVSPDGTSIAFVSTQDGNPELYRMKADGSQPQRLTTWRRDDVAPRWSPDGQRLAFLRREQGGERLFVLELPTDAPPAERRMVETTEGEPVKHADVTWSPDGKALAFTEHRPRTAPRIMVVELDSGATRSVSPPQLRATMPSWSPDGTMLAFAGTEKDPDALDLYALRLEDGAWARLTKAEAPDWLPRWSAK